MLFHKKLKTLRLEREWSQAELAERLGIDRIRVSTYENGKVVPETKLLVKMAEVFDVSLDYLVFGNEEGSSPKIDFKDRDLLKQFQKLDSMDKDARRVVKELIELVIFKDDMKNFVNKKAAIAS